MGERQADVLVLGAGVTACASALELARGGQRVVVLEAETPFSGATADLGHLPVGMGVPYRLAVQRLGREGAREVWETHREGQERLREALADLAATCGYHQAGGFLLAENRAEATALADSEDLLREDGFAGEFLDHYMLESRFGVTGFAGAYWGADEGEIDGALLIGALCRAAHERGVVRQEGPLLELELARGGAQAQTAGGRVRAPWVVVAVAAGAPRLLASLEGPVVVQEGERLAVLTEPGAAVPSPARTAGGDRAWRRVEDGLHLVQFGLPEPRAGEEEALAKKLGGQPLPHSRRRVRRDACTDGLPRIGRLPGLGVLLATGYGGLEYSYALLAARWIADTVRTGHDSTPPRFRADRA